jgi:predicted acylesterase/phospholipase RssA
MNPFLDVQTLKPATGTHSMDAGMIATRTAPIALLLLILLAPGCRSAATGPTPASVGIPPSELIDPHGYGDSPELPIARDFFRVGERIRTAQRPAQPYQAGLLVGWSETGTRPAFDSVTGVSTGALVATLVFLGPDYDCELTRVYTTLRTEDIYTKKRGIRALTSDSLADNTPLARQIDRVLTPAAIARMAEEHRKGRRLYVGTSDLDGRRPVVWDLGAIAARDEPGARELIAKLLLASAAIPAFFPPVEIAIDVDGQRLVERHVDGGVTQNVFFRPPQVPQEMRLRPPADFLYGSDLYIIVAGKVFNDPEPVKPRALKIAAASVSSLIGAETRTELVKLYTFSMVAGMNYNLASIPQDFPAPTDSTEFNPAQMTQMFEEGRRQALTNTAWRNSPPGVLDGEGVVQRAGTRLIRQPRVAPVIDPLQR